MNSQSKFQIPLKGPPTPPALENHTFINPSKQLYLKAFNNRERKHRKNPPKKLPPLSRTTSDTTVISTNEDIDQIFLDPVNNGKFPHPDTFPILTDPELDFTFAPTFKITDEYDSPVTLSAQTSPQTNEIFSLFDTLRQDISSVKKSTEIFDVLYEQDTKETVQEPQPDMNAGQNVNLGNEPEKKGIMISKLVRKGFLNEGMNVKDLESAFGRGNRANLSIKKKNIL
ncbi:hypothetical protein HK098_008282 [Nowakowskiella sp. JEL0407]|nr:hypothetical protein HK098_008282 [Nowakowskiella sp. JEL0407]